jgi:hypothetical protein
MCYPMLSNWYNWNIWGMIGNLGSRPRRGNLFMAAGFKGDFNGDLMVFNG